MFQNFSGQKLREMRKEAGYTQIDLAKRLGISRETVIAIEREHPGTINSIELQVINKWWKVCSQSISQSTKQDFIDYVKGFLSLS